MNSEERREAALAKADDVAWKLKNLCQVEIDDEILNMLSQQIAIAALEAAGLNELVEALEKIGGTGWSSPEIDGRGADTLSQIFFEIQNIAQAALTGDKSNG